MQVVMARRFWTAEDVVDWIKANVPDDRLHTEGSEEAAIWWCCYRHTEALVDDTIRHVAQALRDGVGPFYASDVTLMVQDWFDDEGNSGDSPGIDEAIEADLRKFFQVEVT